MASISIVATLVIDALTSTKLNFQNQETIRLDQFNGINYTKWKDEMIFILTSLKTLDQNLSPIP